MGRTQSDVEAALFGSPLGALDMVLGLLTFLVAISALLTYAVSRIRRPRGRHRA